MELTHIRSLLAPFLPSGELSDQQLEQVSQYLALLLKWNARINLTSVREPDAILQRHFGESFFLANCALALNSAVPQFPISAVDVGSGAGFPGLPFKIFAPAIHLSLVESNAKKAAFLKEAVRALGLTDVNVINARAETLLSPSASSQQPAADLVTMRAVERFDKSLPIAAKLVAKGGTLALLIGSAQVRHAHELLPSVRWSDPLPVPLSENRIVLLGKMQVG